MAGTLYDNSCGFSNLDGSWSRGLSNVETAAVQQYRTHANWSSHAWKWSFSMICQENLALYFKKSWERGPWQCDGMGQNKCHWYIPSTKNCQNVWLHGLLQKWQEWTGCPGNGRSGRPTPPGAKFSQLCNQAAVKGSGSKVRVPDFHSGFACFASVDAPVPKCPKWENA